MSDFTVTTYAKTKDELGRLVATLASDGFSFVVEANGSKSGAAFVEPVKAKRYDVEKNGHCVYKSEPKPDAKHTFNAFRNTFGIGSSFTLNDFVKALEANGYKASSASPSLSRLKFGGYIIANDQGSYTRVK
jgi:hypothetical protein